MVATNALLSLGLAIVGNLTNLVPIPPQDVPITTNDLQKYVVGSPRSPVEVCFFVKGGSWFVITSGVVKSFRSPGSFFSLQEPSLVPMFLGAPIIDSNQVMSVAIAAVQSLTKTGNILAYGTPRLIDGGVVDGKQVPFYKVQFRSKDPNVDNSADFEIDARTGRIVRFELWDPGFRDPAMDQQIRKAVYTREPAIKMPYVSFVRKFHIAQPATNEVKRAIQSYLLFCQRFGLDPGPSARPGNVDWDETQLWTNALVSETKPVSQVHFKDGSSFESFEGIIISYMTADACFKGDWEQRPKEDWASFQGKIIRDYKDLAADFEQRLVERAGISQRALAAFSARPQYIPPEVGSNGLKRVVLEWRNWPAFEGRVAWVSETELALMGEFDLETGELKSFSLLDRDFIKSLGEAERKWARTAPRPP